MFATWGEIFHRHRWAVAVLSLLSLAVAGALIVRGGHFDPSLGSLETEFVAALRLMEQALPARPVTFRLILSSPTHATTDQAFAAEVQRALVPLRGDPRVAAIRTAYDGGAPDPRYLSRDGRHTLAVVELALRSAEVTSVGFASVAADVYAALRARVRSDVLQILPAGDVALNRDFQEISHRDLWRCELAILSVLPALLVARVRFGGGGLPAPRRGPPRRGRGPAPPGLAGAAAPPRNGRCADAAPPRRVPAG